MRKKDLVGSKEKILAAAEQIFAEVGFDGARVDDIALKAGVNKALIYYYFESKDAILDELFETLMADGKSVQNQALSDYPNMNREDMYMEFMEKNLEFALSHRNLIKIALAESMKTSSKHSGLLKRCDLIIETELEYIKKVYESKDISFPYSKKEIAVMEFFTGIMPIFNYAVYSDTLADFYEMSELELKELFLKAFRLTHMSGHQKLYKR
jgi:AcrR family transcriptional regulator